jgi:hypothetical protein
MSASSSMTRTEIVPLRMPRPTVLGTPGAFVVFGQLGTAARRDVRRRGATIGFLPDDSDRWWPLPERRCAVAISLPKSLPQAGPGTSTWARLPWSPPSGRPASGGHGFVLLRANGGGAMVQERRFPVAVRLRGGKFRQGGPCREFSLPGGGGRSPRRGPRRGPRAVLGSGPRHRAGDQRPGTTGQGPERKVPERHEKRRSRR